MSVSHQVTDCLAGVELIDTVCPMRAGLAVQEAIYTNVKNCLTLVSGASLLNKPSRGRNGFRPLPFHTYIGMH